MTPPALAPAPTLRDYQLAAVAGAELAFSQGVRSALLVQATGTGKTTAAGELVRRHLAGGGRRALFLAQRRELLDQAAARLALFGVPVVRGLQPGAEGACHVASVQGAARALDRLSADAFDFIVLDEAHHAPAPQHLAVLAHFPHARIVGLTATPDRADGASLGLAFERCVARYDVLEAVRDGHLVPARGVRVEVAGMDLSKVRLKPLPAEGSSEGAWRDIADLHQRDLGRAALAPAAVEGIVGPLLELAAHPDGTPMRTVVFAVNRRHAAALASTLCARGATAAIVHGGMAKTDRERALEAFAIGEFDFLVNVMLLVEGWDLPTVECVALARPTTSRTFVAQACGRGLRPSPGKTECVVIDFTSSTAMHSLVGPEDVLAGALVGPMSRYGAPRPPPATELAPYAPRTWRARFATRAITLMRRAGRAAVRTRRMAATAGRAVVGVGRAGARAARAVRRGLWRLLFGDD